MPRRAPLLVTLGLTLCPGVAAATPQDLFGFGPRASAMAGTGGAFLDDASAVHANPAALSRIRGRRLTLGYAGAAFDLRYDGRSVPAASGSATVLGVGFELPFGGALRRRVGVGLGFFTPTDVVVRARVMRPETPQFIALPDRVQSVAIQLGLGVDIGYGVRLGAGASALAGLTGSVIVATDGSGRSTSRIDDQLIAQWAPLAGASWERGDWRVGITWRGALTARFDVVIDATGIGVPIPLLNITGIAQYDPEQLHIEGAWSHGAWLVAVALTGKRWSAFERVRDATSEGRSAPPPPTEFHDTIVARAAFERRWALTERTGVAVRGGAFYEPSPALEPTAARGYLDNDRLAVTAGLQMSARVGTTGFAAEVYAQLHGLIPRRGVGADGREVTYGGTLGVAGLSASVDF